VGAGGASDGEGGAGQAAGIDGIASLLGISAGGGGRGSDAMSSSDCAK
jgi:hypothetical protein